MRGALLRDRDLKETRELEGLRGLRCSRREPGRKRDVSLYFECEKIKRPIGHVVNLLLVRRVSEGREEEEEWEEERGQLVVSSTTATPSRERGSSPQPSRRSSNKTLDVDLVGI